MARSSNVASRTDSSDTFIGKTSPTLIYSHSYGEFFGGMPSASAGDRIAMKRIGERVCDGVAHHVLIFRTQEPAQAIGIHNVFPRHVRDGFGWNGRNLILPQEFQHLPHRPFSWDANQFCVRDLHTTPESQRLAAPGDVQDSQALGLGL